MKLVVETTGMFQLMGYSREHFIGAFRPHVVPPSAGTETHIAAGRVKLLGKVADTATDAELAEWLKADGTVEDFIAANSAEQPAETETEAPSGGRRRR